MGILVETVEEEDDAEEDCGGDEKSGGDGHDGMKPRPTMFSLTGLIWGTLSSLSGHRNHDNHQISSIVINFTH